MLTWSISLLLLAGDAHLLSLAHLPIELGVWQSHIAGHITDGWFAKPGEVYRMQTRWSGAGRVHLCLHSGHLEAPEYELEDVKQESVTCPTQDEAGLSVATLRVPKGANGVWYTTAPEGGRSTLIQIRIEKN